MSSITSVKISITIPEEFHVSVMLAVDKRLGLVPFNNFFNYNDQVNLQ